MPRETVVTPEFRVSFPNILSSREVEKDTKDGKMKVAEYSMLCLFPPGADLSKLKALASAAAKEKWGDKIPANMRNPFRDQAEKEKDGKLPEGHVAGAIFINVKSSTRPGLVDANLQPILDASDFYAGCWARAQVHAYPYEQKGNKGVSFGLDNVQKLRDGESLSGRIKAEDAFEAVAGAADSGTGGVFD